MNWNEKFELAKVYYEHHGHLRVVISFKTKDGYSYDEDGFELGLWISRQRHQYKIKELTQEHYEKLKSIGMIFEDLNKLDWETFYNLALIYVDYHGKLPVSENFRTTNGYEYDEKGKNLGAWFRMQRNNYNHKELSEERMEKMALLFKKSEEKKEEQKVVAENEWELMYELAVCYHKEHGHLNVPTMFKTNNGYEYDKKGKNLGEWIRIQRKLYKNGKLTSEQIQKLAKINLLFTNFIENEWERMYKLAKAYYAHNGDLKVPRQFITKNGYEYDKNGSKLGKWVNTQYCRNVNGFVTEEQREKLKAIGMIFENQKGTAWQKMYALAKAYYEHHGNLEVLTSFKTKNGYEYDKDGENLGIWINGQRKSYLEGKLSKNHVVELKAIGMVLVNLNDARWERMYDLAKVYYEHYGNLLIDINFKTKNGYEYDEEGENLGGWVNRQRLAHRYGKLYVDRVKKLKLIGMSFESLQDKQWENMYALAVSYYIHYHNLNVPYSFKTKNGYEYDEEGRNLGDWILTQRAAYKNKKLSKGRFEKLQIIGMVFETKTNKAKNEKVCTEHGINYIKYKEQIDTIPYIEFISKINYLSARGFPLLINEQLNPIFFTSSVNMEVKYGISLEQLIMEYQPSLKKVKRG